MGAYNSHLGTKLGEGRFAAVYALSVKGVDSQDLVVKVIKVTPQNSRYVVSEVGFVVKSHIHTQLLVKA
jgi:hypothetical protein